MNEVVKRKPPSNGPDYRVVYIEQLTLTEEEGNLPPSPATDPNARPVRPSQTAGNHLTRSARYSHPGV